MVNCGCNSDSAIYTCSHCFGPELHLALPPDLDICVFAKWSLAVV